MDWETVWHSILASVAVGVVVVCGVVILHPQEITYYYGSSSNEHGACVYSHWTWHTDERVFCPQNQAELPDYVAKLNASLPKAGDLASLHSQVQDLQATTQNLERFANGASAILHEMQRQ